MSLYNIITFIIVLITGAIAVGMLKQRIAENTKDIECNQRKCDKVPVLGNKVENVEKELIELKANHNVLDKKLDSISQALHQLIGKIDAWITQERK